MTALYNPPSYDSPTSSTPTTKPESLPQTELRFGILSSFPIFASSSGQTAYSIPIKISANKNKVNLVQLAILYDPQTITQISLAPGTFFQNPVSFLDEKNEKDGRISYAIGIPPNTSGIEGEGTVVTLLFLPKSQSKKITTLSFLPKTFVTAEGSNQSVLKKTSPAQIVIGENIASPSGNIDN